MNSPRDCLYTTRTVVIITTTRTVFKNFLCLCGGPLFMGAPVRPNMLDMPKSASAA